MPCVWPYLVSFIQDYVVPQDAAPWWRVWAQRVLLILGLVSICDTQHGTPRHSTARHSAQSSVKTASSNCSKQDPICPTAHHGAHSRVRTALTACFESRVGNRM